MAYSKLLSSRYILIITCVFSFLASASASASASYELSNISAKTPNKILFVGNSFSFYNNGIHNQVSNLVRANGLWKSTQNRYRLMTLSGGKLSEHIKLLNTFLSEGKTQWDLIILQEYSSGPIIDESTSHFRSSTRELVKDIRANGSHAALFMTWAYADKPKMIFPLAKAYQELGKELHIPVFPVGLAFTNSQQKYPDTALLIPDVLGVKNRQITYKKTLKHPSVAGSYLAACVIYSVLYGESAQGNPYRAGLPNNIALNLQNVAWQTVKEFL